MGVIARIRVIFFLFKLFEPDVLIDATYLAISAGKGWFILEIGAHDVRKTINKIKRIFMKLILYNLLFFLHTKLLIAFSLLD